MCLLGLRCKAHLLLVFLKSNNKGCPGRNLLRDNTTPPVQIIMYRWGDFNNLLTLAPVVGLPLINNFRRRQLSVQGVRLYSNLHNQLIMLNTPSVFINSSPIENQVIEMLSWQLHVDVSSIRPYTRFRDDLMMDAVDINLLIAQLESRLNVYLSAEEIEGIETVADAGRCFRAHQLSPAAV